MKSSLSCTTCGAYLAPSNPVPSLFIHVHFTRACDVDPVYMPTLPVNTGVDTIIVNPAALQEFVPLPYGYFYDPTTGYFMYNNGGGDYIAIDAQEIFG